MHGRIITNTIKAYQISQINVIYQLSKPRCITGGHASPSNIEGILGRIPVLRMNICFGCGTHIAHCTCTSIWSDGERRHTSVHRIEHILLVLRFYGCRNSREDEDEPKGSI